MEHVSIKLVFSPSASQPATPFHWLRVKIFQLTFNVVSQSRQMPGVYVLYFSHGPKRRAPTLDEKICEFFQPERNQSGLPVLREIAAFRKPMPRVILPIATIFCNLKLDEKPSNSQPRNRDAQLKLTFAAMFISEEANPTGGDR